MSPLYKGIGKRQQKFKEVIDRIGALTNKSEPQWTMDHQSQLERLHALRIHAQVEMLAELRQ